MSPYCYQCGHELENRELENRVREVCARCGWINYVQLKVSAAALVEKEGKVLLVQRSAPPWQGCWYLPAGYVEADEDPQRAAERELFEETGLIARVESLAGIHYFDDDPRGNGVLIVYRCEWKSGLVNLNGEANNFGWFPRDEIPQPLTGAGHEAAIRIWASA